MISININKVGSYGHVFFIACSIFLLVYCEKTSSMIKASDLLGNWDYPAICYSGYRTDSRAVEPTIEEIKSDLVLLHELGYRVVRTYNVHFEHTANILDAITELKQIDSDFEMYVMLGVWINCKGAFSDNVEHTKEDYEANLKEAKTAFNLVKQYPKIVKIIAVGNEAMVHWQTNYFVGPQVILSWVNYFQELKKTNQIPDDIWVTSSDNFASWGGGDASYHNDYLAQLYQAVDYISMHTYPFHDTYYSQTLWAKDYDNNADKVDYQMQDAVNYAIAQYDSVKAYMLTLGIEKPIHIGETGWATFSTDFYGDLGTCAADEYKQQAYFMGINDWAKANDISVFFFEAFDESWKDFNNPSGSENHFGLFSLQGQAKYTVWSQYDLDALLLNSRDGKRLNKTFNGKVDSLKNIVRDGKIFKYGI